MTGNMRMRIDDVIAGIRLHPPAPGDWDELNRQLDLLLKTCPESGTGVHAWIFNAARALWRAPFNLRQETIMAALREAAGDCGRPVPEAELLDAVRNSSPFACPRPPARLPGARGSAIERGGPRRRASSSSPKLPEEDPAAVGRILGRTEEWLLPRDLILRSPAYAWHWRPEAVQAKLYPDNPILCFVFVRERSDGSIACRWDDRRQLPSFPSWMIPNPLRGRSAPTSEGKPSPRALSNIAERRYLVLDFDKGSRGEQATIIWHLKTAWKERGAGLVMVLWTGGKGLHAWWYVRHLGEAEVWILREEASRLGACSSTLQNRAQLVRVPNARRADSGERQSVYFFNEEEIRI